MLLFFSKQNKTIENSYNKVYNKYTIVVIMLIYSSYSNHSLIVILWKGSHDKNKQGNSNTVDGSDKEKDDHSESKGSLDERLKVLCS